jgi:hypothetical protein
VGYDNAAKHEVRTQAPGPPIGQPPATNHSLTAQE